MKCGVTGLILLPSAGFACALPPSVILTLPTGHYIAAAAAVVAATALLGAAAHRMPELRSYEVARGMDRFPFAVTTYLAFVGFLGLVLVGVWGPTDPMHNLLTLIFWTGVWIALPLASMVLGNLWAGISPWVAPVRTVRILIGRRRSVGLARFGHWPAVAGLFGFSWFQMVGMAPDDPRVLAQAALIYWVVVFVAAVAEGEDWLQQGEFLTVLFGMIARIAPLWRDRAGGVVRWQVGLPGAQIVRMAALSASEVAFVTLALAGLTFDGLSETFFWLALIGENPLEFTGRSAVQGVNSVGLIGVWAVTVAAVLGALRLGRALGGGFAVGPVVLSFLAIAAGYHAAHYLVMLLTAGQFTLSALNDPLFRGDAWLGLPPFYVSFGFLSVGWVVTSVYAAQFVAILGAHMLAVVLALRLAGPSRAVAHLPLTALMVGYTVLGLWLLSTARGI